MRRIMDQPYGTYTVMSASGEGICVKCPRCGGPATVTADKARAYFRCTACGHARTKTRAEYQGIVENLCGGCGRYYRVRVPDSGFSVLRTARPCNAGPGTETALVLCL